MVFANGSIGQSFGLHHGYHADILTLSLDILLVSDCSCSIDYSHNEDTIHQLVAGLCGLPIKT